MFGPYVIRVGSKRLHGGAPDEWWWDLGWLAVPGDYGDSDVDHRHLSLPWTMQKHWTRCKQLTIPYSTICVIIFKPFPLPRSSEFMQRAQAETYLLAASLLEGSFYGLSASDSTIF
ncbi:hypothetical protein K435DRAFT_378180 [Dendrothele bispora CBS 962.96]|uniref:Uncharacterized protein n=1 Tax=Dendrothele bispora (strain CBS 962.96) TaxID=1314807 RepID=A0A4S8LAN2_DENBC|nr:hypothetical protein K435DRAFT_378180 [Dendrothele bispora CBS 962.96]